LGRVKDVHLCLDECLTMKLYGAWSPGLVMTYAAQELRAHGNNKESFEVLNRAIAWYSGQPKTEANRFGLARAYYHAEQWDKARTFLEELAKEDSMNIDYKGFLGTLAVRQGILDEAHRIYEWLGRQRQPYVNYTHIWWQAKISALMGEEERAMTHLRDVYNRGKSYHLDLHRDIDFELLRDYPPFKELIKPKG